MLLKFNLQTLLGMNFYLPGVELSALHISLYLILTISKYIYDYNPQPIDEKTVDSKMRITLQSCTEYK